MMREKRNTKKTYRNKRGVTNMMEHRKKERQKDKHRERDIVEENEETTCPALIMLKLQAR